MLRFVDGQCVNKTKYLLRCFTYLLSWIAGEQGYTERHETDGKQERRG